MVDRTFQKHFLTIDQTSYEVPQHSEETVQALNQFSEYSKQTPVVFLDLRCEYDVPRYCDLKQPCPLDQNQSFLWFQTAHDFFVPASKKVETLLRNKILKMGVPPKQTLTLAQVPRILSAKSQRPKLQFKQCRNLQKTPSELSCSQSLQRKASFNLPALISKQKEPLWKKLTTISNTYLPMNRKRQHSASVNNPTMIVVKNLPQQKHHERARTLSKHSLQSSIDSDNLPKKQPLQQTKVAITSKIMLAKTLVVSQSVRTTPPLTTTHRQIKTKQQTEKLQGQLTECDKENTKKVVKKLKKIMASSGSVSNLRTVQTSRAATGMPLLSKRFI